jgi:two-component system KDP operon response regulator KdpE
MNTLVTNGELRMEGWPAVRTAEAEAPAVFCSGDLQVDLVNQRVEFKGRKVELSWKEFSLLTLFIKQIGRVLTHGYLLREVWGATDPTKMDRLRFCMEHLQEKFESEAASPELVFANTNLGYRMVLRK